MQLPLPEVDDSKSVIFFKLMIVGATIAMMSVTTITQTIKVIKMKKKKIGFGKEK